MSAIQSKVESATTSGTEKGTDASKRGKGAAGRASEGETSADAAGKQIPELKDLPTEISERADAATARPKTIKSEVESMMAIKTCRKRFNNYRAQRNNTAPGG